MKLIILGNNFAEQSFGINFPIGKIFPLIGAEQILGCVLLFLLISYNFQDILNHKRN